MSCMVIYDLTVTALNNLVPRCRTITAADEGKLFVDEFKRDLNLDWYKFDHPITSSKWNKLHLVTTRGFVCNTQKRWTSTTLFSVGKKNGSCYPRTPGWLVARPSADELSPDSGGGSLPDTLSSCHTCNVPNRYI